MGMRGIQLGLRVWEFLWSLLILALVGNMIADAFAGNPSVINYTMFVAAFGMFSLFYLVPASFNLDWAVHPIIMIVVDLLNALLFFTCAIALASKLEAHSCSNRAYTTTNSITNGSVHLEKRCREAQASTAFLWFAWAGFTASTILSVLMSRRSGANLRGRTGPPRGSLGRPSMAQV